MPGFRQRRCGQRETPASTRARYGTFGAHLYDMRAILAVMQQDVLLPSGDVLDVALLRATVVHTDLVPDRIVWDPPSAHGELLVSGFDGSGATVDIPQRVRFESTLLIIGDRDASILDGCIGASAAAGGGAFGIVTSCEPGKAPKITLFRAARPFIERHTMSARNRSR